MPFIIIFIEASPDKLYDGEVTFDTYESTAFKYDVLFATDWLSVVTVSLRVPQPDEKSFVSVSYTHLSVVMPNLLSSIAEFTCIKMSIVKLCCCALLLIS